jgi:hypothetical protein
VHARQLFVLAGLLGAGALVSAALPGHPLFNQPEGPFVLGGMALLAAATGLFLRRRARAGEDDRPAA